jgi:hypothetical protein
LAERLVLLIIFKNALLTVKVKNLQIEKGRVNDAFEKNWMAKVVTYFKAKSRICLKQ